MIFVVASINIKTVADINFLHSMQCPRSYFRSRWIICRSGSRKHITCVGNKPSSTTKFLQSIRIIHIIISVPLLTRKTNFIISLIYIKSEKFQHLFFQIFAFAVIGNQDHSLTIVTNILYHFRSICTRDKIGNITNDSQVIQCISCHRDQCCRLINSR